MQEQKVYVIFSNHCAGWLMTKGLPLLEVSKRDKGDKPMNVYVFKNSEILHKLLNDYKALFKK